jgi:hypothetical protein
MMHQRTQQVGYVEYVDNSLQAARLDEISRKIQHAILKRLRQAEEENKRMRLQRYGCFCGRSSQGLD